MSTHNIGFYEDLTKIIYELSKFHQIRTLFLLLIHVRSSMMELTVPVELEGKVAGVNGYANWTLNGNCFLEIGL